MESEVKRKPPVVLAVAGAKGGVGKSMVCSNLAAQLAKTSLKVLVVDCDLGAANQHTLLGISQSHAGWTQWLKEDHLQLSDFVVDTAVDHLQLIPASGLMSQVAQIPPGKKERFYKELKTLDCDVILLDCGAGSHLDTVDLFLQADLRLIVTTPEPTALINNFEFIKNVMYRALCHLYRQHPDLSEAIDLFRCETSSSMSKLKKTVESTNAWAAELLEGLCESLKISIIFNQMKKVDEATLACRLKKIVQKQLHIKLSLLGFVFYNEEILASVLKRSPISHVNPQAISSQIFEKIAAHLFDGGQDLEKESILWKQLQHDFSKNRASRKKLSTRL